MADYTVVRRVTQIGGYSAARRTGSPTDHRSDSKKRQLALDSPTRNVPISTDRLSFITGRGNEHESKRARIDGVSIKASRSFHSFMELDQAGPAKIARDENHTLVALKVIDFPPETLQIFEAENVVNLIDIFRKSGQTFLVYELMCVSLRQIQGTSRGLQIQPFEIAAICKEILNGLSYIHQVLKLIHGDLNCGEIMLNNEGRVKIANVGISMTEKRIYDKAKESLDTRGLGSIMMELMETETWISDPSSLSLRYPEKWKDSHGIKSFLHDTSTCNIEQLKKHDFLPKESLQEICLKELVLVAQVSAMHDWEVYTKERIDQES